jgi:hypothetical protein
MAMKRCALAAATALVLALAGCSSSGTPEDPLLTNHGLAGLTGRQIVDELEGRALADRPTDLKASVRPAELQLSDAAGKALNLPLPTDAFYLAIAPYVDGTHDCFYHSLTTCTGELGGKDVHVTITQDDGTVLVDEQAATHPDGFVSYWLPRGSSGTVQIAYDGKSGSYAFATDDEAPTCLTTLHLT